MRRCAVLGMTLSVLAGAGTAAATPKAQTIPLHKEAGDALSVEGSIKGKHGTFLFDSGWGLSAVTPGTADRIGCHPWGQVTGFRAIGERITSAQCQPATVTLGNRAFPLPTLAVVDMQHFMPPGSPTYAGGIGLDAFAGRLVTLRSSAGEIVLETPATLKVRIAHARAIPIRLVRDVEGAALTVNVGIPTTQGTLWMELDTGNTGPTLIGRHAAALVGLKSDGEGVQDLAMPLMPGVVVHSRARVQDLIMDGDIGRDFLNQWDLTLDLAHEKGWLTPAMMEPVRPVGITAARRRRTGAD